MITAKTQICMIIGDPVEHSLSPSMHNAAYKELDMSDEFVFIASHVLPDNLEKAVNGIRSLGVRGTSVTIPHKVEVIKYLDVVDPIAQQIGAVNTIVNTNGTLTGYNTDWLGVKTAFEKNNLAIQGKKAAVMGAGGASRAIVYALQQLGANVTIFNRTLKTAQQVAHDFGATAETMETIHKILDMDIIANSTSLGMGEHISKSPVPNDFLKKEHVIFDAVYVPYETRLIQDAKHVGANCIHGLDMLLYQGTAQFEMYTNKQAPEDIMRKILLDNALKQ